MFDGIHHVAVVVRDIEKALGFYRDVLGLPLGKRATVADQGVHAALLAAGRDEIELLDDIIVDNNQCAKQAEIYSNILASLMDARASIVSNNLNILIKFLNIITIGIMVPTFVVSAFSMNVGIPLSGHPFAFWIIMGLALVSVLGFMLFWRHKGVAGKGL